ncbi:MAG: hypothetical protein IBX55_00980 [Methyloprofundus sp.]|nr:hypothetical protein [Methyloprofundus sp.]
MEKNQVKKMIRDIDAFFSISIPQTDETLNRAWIIVGSQAIHFSLEDITKDNILGMSNELDLFLINTQDPFNSKLNDNYGELASFFGEGSFYYETFGVFADPVSLNTAIFPDGWMNRLEKMAFTENANAYAPDIHDLAVSKIFAYIFRSSATSEFKQSKDYSYLEKLKQYLDQDLVKKRIQEVNDKRVTKEIKYKALLKAGSLFKEENIHSETHQTGMN